MYRWAVIVWVGLGAGCAKPWRPPLTLVQRKNLPAVFDLTEYMPDQPGWEWVYSRTHEEEEPNRFVRQLVDQIYVEGTLVGRPFGPLSSYLPPPSSGGQPLDQGAMTGPPHRAPLRGDVGTILEFDPPLEPLPARLSIDGPAVTDVRFTCYNEWGRHLYDGAARRVVTLQGLEDIRIGQTEWPKCLVLHVDTIWHFYWGPIIEISQYLWLARGVGEVRRIEHVTGLFFILAIAATERYELQSCRPPLTPATQTNPATSTGPGPRAFRRWARLAMEMLQTLPSPRPGGMRVELIPPDAQASGYRPRTAGVR
jgi:hypothetical protein